MEDANAFYSERDHGLLFGYFRGRDGKTVFTSLSHDIVAHETTHAILDGLRDHYTDPSVLDQAGFHEGFADVVALLSVFSLEDLLVAVLESSEKARRAAGNERDAAWLKRSALFGLAEEMGQELSPSTPRMEALRRSVDMRPDPAWRTKRAFQEPHRRGEVLVQAVMDAFAEVWAARVQALDETRAPIPRLGEEGAKAAGHLLTMAIRALDYCPPVDLSFEDYLSALLTADVEVVPEDRPYGYRTLLRAAFGKWNIEPAADAADGTWAPPKSELAYEGIRFDSLRSNPDEVFRFLWQNRDLLRVDKTATTKVNWVRPVVRVGPDGFVVRETVAEFVQWADLQARDWERLDVAVPEGVPSDARIRLYGGSTLVFDEFGRVKYEVHKGFANAKRQSAKLQDWWDAGLFGQGARMGMPLTRPSEQFAAWHRLRMAQLVHGGEAAR
jgi:hypothetical protein